MKVPNFSKAPSTKKVVLLLLCFLTWIVKTEISAEESSKMKEFSKRFSADTDKETKLKRERFYDLYTRVSNDPNFKIDIDGLNLSLNIRIEEFPDDSKIIAMFEELNSKSSMIARGKKNWSEPETFLCIWIVMVYCHLNDRDFNDMVSVLFLPLSD